MFNLGSPLAVVCHDAGAANIIVAWVQALKFDKNTTIQAYMEGPALKIWKHVLPDIPLSLSLEQAFEGATALISGTGWASDLEHRSLAIAKEKHVFSVAVIDHWINYHERFYRHQEYIYPDEFWVTDDEARRLAEESFSQGIVRQQSNLYFSFQLDNISGEGKNNEILYIAEPIRSDWGRGVEGEFQALDYFVSHLSNLPLPKEFVIRLRPHPSDVPGKYKQWKEKYSDLNICLDTSSQLSEAISSAKWVVGCESYGLVLALAAGRSVYCSLPPWAPECRLPHHNIIHLKKLA